MVAGGISLALAIFVFVTYDKSLGGLQFVEKYEWVKTFGITYFVGVEGLNAPMLLLTGIVIFTGCLTMWELETRTKEYFIWMMALVTGVFGVFMSYDMFFFFLFYEIAVVPMYILILVWGSTRKEYAAMKLTLYLMAGSGLIIPGILLLYSSSGLNTFNMLMLHGAHFTPWIQKVAFILLFFGLRRPGGGLAVPHMVARRPRGRAHRRVHAPRRRVDEAGLLRHPPGGHVPAAPKASNTGPTS